MSINFWFFLEEIKWR